MRPSIVIYNVNGSVHLLLEFAAVAVLLPSKPDILTDFFASERAGVRVLCEEFTSSEEPEVQLKFVHRKPSLRIL